MCRVKVVVAFGVVVVGGWCFEGLDVWSDGEEDVLVWRREGRNG